MPLRFSIAAGLAGLTLAASAVSLAPAPPNAEMKRVVDEAMQAEQQAAEALKAAFR